MIRPEHGVAAPPSRYRLSMTSTPPDPFRAGPQQTPPPAPAPAPPSIPQYQGFAPDPPRGLGTATLIVAAIVTALTLASAATAAEYADVIVDRPADSLDFTAHEILAFLTFLPTLAAFVVMSLWAFQSNVYASYQGRRQRLHKVWAWFMWWIPLANLVLPIIYVWDSVAAKARVWVVVWWLTWLASGVATQVGSLGIGFDGTVDPDFIEIYSPAFWIGAILTVVSFGALVQVVRGVEADEPNGVGPGTIG